MQSLIQIIYISRSTFAPVEAFEGIEPNVARILSKSRANNRKNGLVGVLYFGDGCFFQCLEGEEAAIDALYTKLEQDTRHKDLKLLSRKVVAQRSFADWAMKYVPIDNAMQQLLKMQGHTSFNPYAFDAETTHKVMRLLQIATESVAEAQPHKSIERPAVPARVADKTPPGMSLPSYLPLVLSALSLLISCGALLLTLQK